MHKAIVIHSNDNVANLIGPGEKGAEVTVTLEGQTTTCTLAENIPANHKFARTPIARGADVIKYGQRIGRATCDIAVGQHVHAHNIESLRGRGDLKSR